MRHCRRCSAAKLLLPSRCCAAAPPRSCRRRCTVARQTLQQPPLPRRRPATTRCGPPPPHPFPTKCSSLGAGARGCHRDWRVPRRSLAGGADDNSDEGDARVVVRQARRRPPLPARHPLGRRWQRRRWLAGVARGGVVKTGARGVSARREAPTTTAMTAMTVTKATPGSSSVRRVTVLLPPCAPPLDGDGNSGVGRRGWREGVSLRLARTASELGGRRQLRRQRRRRW